MVISEEDFRDVLGVYFYPTHPVGWHSYLFKSNEGDIVQLNNGHSNISIITIQYEKHTQTLIVNAHIPSYAETYVIYEGHCPSKEYLETLLPNLFTVQ